MRDNENKEIENSDCPCSEYDCERHGKCSECQKYHHSYSSKTSCGK